MMIIQNAIIIFAIIEKVIIRKDNNQKTITGYANKD